MSSHTSAGITDVENCNACIWSYILARYGILTVRVTQAEQQTPNHAVRTIRQTRGNSLRVRLRGYPFEFAHIVPVARLVHYGGDAYSTFILHASNELLTVLALIDQAMRNAAQGDFRIRRRLVAA